MSTLDVIGFGALNLDEILRVPSVVADSETAIEACQSVPGGSAANTIYALAKLGAKTGLMGAVGGDEAGQTLLQDLRQGGIDTTGLTTKSGQKSGRVLAITDRSGRRALYVEPGANSAFSQEDVDVSYARAAKFIHLSSFVGDAQLDCQKWLVSQLPASTRISFAPGAIYARKGLKKLLPILQKTHVLFASEHEIEELAGAEYRAAARHCIAQGCKMVVITLGRGWEHRPSKPQLSFWQSKRQLSTPNVSLEATPGEVFRFASYVTDCANEYTVESDVVKDRIDTTGAGDAYAGGFLHGLLKGKSLQECGRLGDLVARFCITRMGARAGLPTEGQLLEAYRKRYGPPQ